MDSLIGGPDLDEKRRLEECAAEPIRTPGMIQAHGILLGVDASGVIAVVSANAAGLLGRNLGELAGPALAQAVVAGDPVDPMRIEFGSRGYDAIVHRADDLTIVELEPVEGIPEYARTSVIGAIQRLAVLRDADDLCAAAAREIRGITGFDRVTVYRFHEDGHGEIVAEECADDMERYLWLHFPASDIPPQARRLYLTKTSRAIVSTVDAGIPLLAIDRDVADVDLTLAELRSVSPSHLQFMRNMGQESTVSLSLAADGELRGMITCAHRTQRRLPILLRRALEVLANQISLQLSSIAEIETLRRTVHVRERRSALLAPLFASDDIGAALLDGDETVLDLIPADGVAIRLAGVIRTAGTVPPLEHVEAALIRLGDSAYATEALPLERPDLAGLLPDVAGLLVVPLGAPGECLAFFRQEVSRVVAWLGDQTAANRPDPLSPRRSYSAWKQSVAGRAEPWGELREEAIELGRELQGALARRTEAELARLAMHDPLTGLFNRRVLFDRLETALSDEGVARGVALLFVDLDDFKRINDTFGHDTGDAVLVELAQRLVAHSRVDDPVVRLGGDEFVVICERVTESEAEEIARRLVDAISAPIAIGAGEIEVTGSCGVVLAAPGTTGEILLESADAAMYRAKDAGRNRVSS